MNTYTVFLSVWGLVTVALVALLAYRTSLTRQEADWIHLTDDDREDRAIRAQTMIEMKARRLVQPIRALGTVSVLLLLVIIGIWVYNGITTPPPVP